MFTELSCRRLGHKVSMDTAIELAQRFGFAAVEPDVRALVRFSTDDCERLRARLTERGLRMGTAALTVDFRKDQPRYRFGMRTLPRVAGKLAAVGCERVVTYLPCGDTQLRYDDQRLQAIRRLREIAIVLSAFGIRLGLEYVGARTAWGWSPFPFIHSLRQTRELVAAIGYDNVGLVLDSWQWHVAGETVRELRSVHPGEIVAVDLSDADASVPRHQQKLGHCRLPTATGIVNLEEFVAALRESGYRGPIRAESYDDKLKKLGPGGAAARASMALARATRPPAEPTMPPEGETWPYKLMDLKRAIAARAVTACL